MAEMKLIAHKIGRPLEGYRRYATYTRDTRISKMASYLPQLLKMKSDLDALIAAIRSAEGAATPAASDAAEPGAPKKRGRPRLTDEEKKAAKKAGKKAAAAIAAGGDDASDSGASKPKKTLSPEHLAKLRAGREAAKARKAAEAAAKTAAAGAAETVVVSDSDSDSGSDSE